MVGGSRRRRNVLIAVGAGLLFPYAALSQAAKLPRVGFLSARSREAAVEVAPFLQGMRELGYVEGKNVQYEWRFADGDYQRLRPLADELVKLKVDVIVASSGPSVVAAKEATQTIPIVMQSVNEPVRRGFVKSLARPGGNITGVSNLTEATLPKQFDLLIQTVPGLARVGVFINPNDMTPESKVLSEMEAAAKRYAITMTPVRARTLQEIERGFATMLKEGSQAFVVTGSAFFVQHRTSFALWAAKARLPGVYYRRDYVEAGGLMSYGRNAAVGYRRAAGYVDRILKGAKPADLPVDQASIIELVLNKSAAAAIGVIFPGKVLVRADQIIE